MTYQAAALPAFTAGIANGRITRDTAGPESNSTKRAITRAERVSIAREDIGEIELFERFLAGDDEAFHLLFRRHNARIAAYCMKLVRSRQIAEDLAQETWMRAIDLRGRPEKRERRIENPAGFLIRIARNLCLDHLKLRKHHEPVDNLDERLHPSYSMNERSSEEEIALRCLDELPFEYREVLILNIYSGYPLEEIATILGKSPEAIWARASRARKKLRAMVAEAIEQEEKAVAALTREKTI